jgi:hypothetical protein
MNYFQINFYCACYLLKLHQAILNPAAPKELTNQYLSGEIGRSVAQVKRALTLLESLGMIRRNSVRYIMPHKRNGKWIPFYTSRTLTTVLSIPAKPKRSPTHEEYLEASIKHNLGAEFWFGVNVARNPDGDGLDWATVPYRDGSPGCRRLFSMGPEVKRFMGHLPGPNGKVVWV